MPIQDVVRLFGTSKARTIHFMSTTNTAEKYAHTMALFLVMIFLVIAGKSTLHRSQIQLCHANICLFQRKFTPPTPPLILSKWGNIAYVHERLVSIQQDYN